MNKWEYRLWWVMYHAAPGVMLWSGAVTLIASVHSYWVDNLHGALMLSVVSVMASGMAMWMYQRRYVLTIQPPKSGHC